MELGQAEGFFTFSFQAESESKLNVSVQSALEGIVETWGCSTRVSPVRGLPEFQTDPEITDSFEGSSTLVLTGPISPLAFLRWRADVRLWLGLGLFNCILSVQCPETLQAILTFLDEDNVAYERLSVVDGCLAEPLGSTIQRPRPKEKGGLDWRTRLGSFARQERPVHLREQLREYTTLLASTLARGEGVLPTLTSRLLKLHDFVELLCSEPESDVNNSIRGHLTHINAGLSRLSSQMFSGTSPVCLTECHFWTHSLFGTGLANLALLRLQEFVENRVGAYRIAGRIQALADCTDGLPSEKEVGSCEYWRSKPRPLAEISHSSEESIVPVLPYFSGRDGFKANLTTLSAPLATITHSSSSRWTLLTLTHEISHLCLRGVLGTIYPDTTGDTAGILEIAGASYEPKNWGEVLQRHMIYTAVALQREENARGGGSELDELNEGTLVRLLTHWQREIEETAVHVFDYLYFYGQELERYVKGIWLSWSTLPEISGRIREYLLRTLSAAFVSHLDRGSDVAASLARQRVLDALGELRGEGVPYVEEAHRQLESEDDWPALKTDLMARVRVASLVYGLLYSEELAVSLQDDAGFESGSDRGGYNLKVNRFEDRVISNPLSFIAQYATSSEVSARKTYWMLHIIAFSNPRLELE